MSRVPTAPRRGGWIGSRGVCTPSIGTPTIRSAVTTRARCLRWAGLGSVRDAPCWPLAWWWLPAGGLVPALSVSQLGFGGPGGVGLGPGRFLGSGLCPLGKLGTRFLPATAAAFLAVQGLRVRQPWGLAMVAVIAVAVPLIDRVCRRCGPPRRLRGLSRPRSTPLFGLSASVWR